MKINNEDKDSNADGVNNLTSSAEEYSLMQKSASNEGGILGSKEANKKRVQKARITSDMIRKLPEGIIYHESQSSDADDEPK